MAIKDSLIPEFDHELATTRRVLGRVPEGELTWKPHDKSMSLGELAAHLANLPLWCQMTLERAALDLDEVGDVARLVQPTSHEAIMQGFDTNTSAARARLVETTDGEMLAAWTLKKGGHEIFTMPRISAIRTFVMNHLIHHRGQLTVYLRLKDVPLPPIYGPTADEQ